MSALHDQLRADLQDAMRSRDVLRRETIRFLEAAIQNAEIERRGPLDDTDIVTLIQKQVRQREESVAQFRAAARADLADKEEAEIAVLQAYLPQQMSRAAIQAAAQAVIARTGASGRADKGKVMGPLMAELRGRADGRLINEIVQELLGD